VNYAVSLKLVDGGAKVSGVRLQSFHISDKKGACATAGLFGKPVFGEDKILLFSN